jgi:hypothetical protein
MFADNLEPGRGNRDQHNIRDPSVNASHATFCIGAEAKNWANPRRA